MQHFTLIEDKWFCDYDINCPVLGFGFWLAIWLTKIRTQLFALDGNDKYAMAQKKSATQRVETGYFYYCNYFYWMHFWYSRLESVFAFGGININRIRWVHYDYKYLSNNSIWIV